MSAVLNISTYKFASLTDLVPLRDRLRIFTVAHGLRGTILLSPEGINLESVLRHKTLVMTQSAAKAINDALVKTRGGQG